MKFIKHDTNITLLNKYNLLLNRFWNIQIFTFYYIKYIYLISNFLFNISDIINKIKNINLIQLQKLIKHYWHYVFSSKVLKLSQNLTKYKEFNQFKTSGFSAINKNTYLIQKNFLYYISRFTVKLNIFHIQLNFKKMAICVYSFKIILINLFFFNHKVITWGTEDFKSEINSINSVWTIKNWDSIDFNLFYSTNLFSSDVTYNIKVYKVLRMFSQKTNRNLSFLVLQDSSNVPYIIQRFKFFSIGCFGNLKLKHTYSFLIPVDITKTISKFFIFGFVFSYKNVAHRYQLLKFLLYYQKYKFFICLK